MKPQILPCMVVVFILACFFLVAVILCCHLFLFLLQWFLFTTRKLCREGDTLVNVWAYYISYSFLYNFIATQLLEQFEHGRSLVFCGNKCSLLMSKAAVLIKWSSQYSWEGGRCWKLIKKDVSCERLSTVGGTIYNSGRVREKSYDISKQY